MVLTADDGFQGTVVRFSTRGISRSCDILACCGAASVTGMSDVRVLWLEAATMLRRRARSRSYPAVVLFAGLGVWVGAYAVTASSAGAGWVTAWAAAVSLAAWWVGRQGVPSDPLPVTTTTADDGVQGTVLRKPPGLRRARALLLAVLAALPGWVAAVMVVRGEVELAIFTGVIAALLGLPAVNLLTGRVRGEAILVTPQDLRVRVGRTWVGIAWDEILAVRADEPFAHVGLTLTADAAALSAINKQSRTVLGSEHESWTRSRKRSKLGVRDRYGLGSPGPDEVLLAVRGWGLMATDVARLVLALASDPAARRDAADVTAMTARLGALRSRPVLRRRESLTVGADPSGASEQGDELDRWLPVWALPYAEQGVGSFPGGARVRRVFELSVLPIFLPVANLSLRGPDALGVAGATAAVAEVNSRSKFHAATEDVIVHKSRFRSRKIVLDRAALTYRSWWVTRTVPWSQLVQADAMWGHVVRIKTRGDATAGGETVWRLTSRGMVAGPDVLVRQIEAAARRGDASPGDSDAHARDGGARARDGEATARDAGVNPA